MGVLSREEKHDGSKIFIVRSLGHLGSFGVLMNLTVKNGETCVVPKMEHKILQTDIVVLFCGWVRLASKLI